MKLTFKQKIFLTSFVFLFIYTIGQVAHAANLDTPPAAGYGAGQNSSSGSATSYNLDNAPASGYGQADTPTTGGSSSGSATTGGLYGAIGGTASCSAGQLLGRIIGSSVGQAIGGMTRNLTNSVVSSVKNALKVPVTDTGVQAGTDAGAQNTAALRNKTVGGGNPGGGILAGIVNSINSVSWDGIAYCMVNQMLTYITQSTVQWINNGFQGNPVFVQNMGSIFKQIENGEKVRFIGEIKAGFQAGRNGTINGVANGTYQIAQPFRNGIYNTIAGYNTNNPFASIPPMSPQLQQNWNSFAGGNWNSGGFSGLIQASQNNPYNNSLAAQQAISMQIAQAQQIQNSQVVNGYQSFYTCRPGAPQPNGYCSPADRIITAPAQGLINETNNISNMKYLRISAAKDFDSIVTALINQLMKLAVNKVFEATNK